MKVPAFLGGSNVTQSPIALNERTINLYPEINQMPGAKSQVQLYPTPGASVFAASIYGPARGSFYQNGRLFFAKGAQLCEYTVAGVELARGALSFTSTDPATFAANGDAGDQLMIVSGGVVTIMDLNTSAITTPAITGTPKQAAYLDGYFLYLTDASTLFKSGLFNATFNPTDFASRSAAPDPWRAVAVNKADKLIWLFGEETSEAWYNAGTIYPFKPVAGGLIPYGIAAAFSVEQVGNSLIWLARTSNGQGDVMMLQGVRPVTISTPALQVAIASYDTISDAIGDTYEALGHTFYILTFPSANATWVYDLSTGMWHERGTWIAEDNQFVALRTLYHVFAFGKTLVGDRESTSIYELTTEAGTDVDDRPIRRVRRGPSLAFENKRLFFPRFELFLESGLGLTSGQGSDPMVMLRTSSDGGKTWSNELMRSAGQRGQYGKRVYWNNLGSARDRQYEVSFSDPIPWRLIDAYVEVQPGTEV